MKNKKAKSEFSRADFIRWGRKGGRTTSAVKTIACRINAKAKRKKGPCFKILKNGCWMWLRAIKNNGYGEIMVNQKFYYSHRFMYEKKKGKIPKNYQLDHLCRNRWCCNPEHLEPVTQKENIRRAIRDRQKIITQGS